MALWLAMIETLYEKCTGVMLWWHALGPLSIVLVIVVGVAGGGWSLGMPGPALEALMYFLAIPWFLLGFSLGLNYMLFGLNRRELGQLSADTVVALLEEVGEPLHYREIHQKLGKPPVTRNDDHVVGLLLLFRNDPRLYSPRWGTYGLVEWWENKPVTDANAVVALLKETGKPLHYREIDQKLNELGLRLTSDGRRGEGRRALNLLVQEDPRLYRRLWDTHGPVTYGPFAYGLVEWQEGKPNDAQAAPANIGRPPRKPVSPTSRRREQPVQNSLPHTPLSGPLELAYEVLRTEGRPLHYAQLADRMLATGKWTTEAKSPSSTLNSYISKHISRHGDASPFFRASRGVYGLREWPKDAV